MLEIKLKLPDSVTLHEVMAHASAWADAVACDAVLAGDGSIVFRPRERRGRKKAVETLTTDESGESA